MKFRDCLFGDLLVAVLVLFAILLAPAFATAQPKAPADVGVAFLNRECCGVVIEAGGGKSLVLTVNHLFSMQAAPRAEYPLPCKVKAKGGKWVDAVAVDGVRHADGDLALVEVPVELPTRIGTLADSTPAVGSTVRHWGATTGPSAGVVTATSGKTVVTTNSADSGDSGAAVYAADGLVVGLLRGYTSDGASVTPTAVAAHFLRQHQEAPKKLPAATAQAEPRGVLVEQTVVGADGRPFTRIVEKPAGYVPAKAAAAPRPLVNQFATPFPACPNGRCR